MYQNIRAYLDDFNTVTVYINKAYYGGESSLFYLSDLKGTKVELVVQEVIEEDNEMVYKCHIDEFDIVFGTEYFVFEEHAMSVVLQFRYIVKTSRFNALFFSDRTDFGALVKEGSTSFVLWAPTAAEVHLMLDPYGDKEIIPMVRKENGVYETTIPSNLHLTEYLYLVSVNGELIKSIDPYGVSSGANSRTSAVIDYATINIDFCDAHLQAFHSYKDAVVFETSVRDFSSNENTNITKKATFSGMLQRDAKTTAGNVAGFSYVKELGATHIQLMPVNDFITVDELNPTAFYNWGYDPVQYFALEGSYSSEPNNPLSRVLEFSELVSGFHKEGIRVNIDVVYNHMFDTNKSAFEAVVPYYFFRRDLQGNFSNGSFCGNDIDTKIPMVRKFIIDSLLHYVRKYHIDGFRFDLMGIIDIETMRQIESVLRKEKSDIMIYGEGWNMPTMLDEEDRSTIKNAHKLENVAFFNDFYRDNVKGVTAFDRKNERGYALGDVNFRDAFKAALLGNASSEFGYTMFSSPNQSVCYVEAHDNMTLWDKIEAACSEDSFEEKIRRQKFNNAVVALSQGIAFYQMGQEFCRSKRGEDNTYRSSDDVNAIDYDKASTFKEVVDYTKDIIALRKEIIYSENVLFEDLDKGALRMMLGDNICIYFNPTKSSLQVNLEANYEVIFDNSGRTSRLLESLDIEPISITILKKT